jgi:valyl-tRNA synthetase
LYTGLLTLLKLIAPIMPFITEEIYQTYFRKQEKDKSIHISTWPDIKKEQKTDEFDLFIEILSKIRQEKTKAQKSMKSEIILTMDKAAYAKLKDLLQDLKDVSNSKEIKEGKEFKIEFI